MNPFATHCDDFCISSHLNTELELPTGRDTVLHYFDRVRKSFPQMSNFAGRDPQEFVLEEDKDTGSYRWMTLEPRRLASGYLNPPDLESFHAQSELMLDLADPLLSVNPLDCEAIDVMFGFDFNCRGNHDEIVAQALTESLGEESWFAGLRDVPQAKVVDYQPTITIALDEDLRLQARLAVMTRTSSYQVRTEQYSEEPLSVYFTIRQYWGRGVGEGSFVDSYRHQFEIGQDMVNTYVLPNIVVPLSEVIGTR